MNISNAWKDNFFLSVFDAPVFALVQSFSSFIRRGHVAISRRQVPSSKIGDKNRRWEIYFFFGVWASLTGHYSPSSAFLLFSSATDKSLPLAHRWKMSDNKSSQERRFICPFFCIWRSLMRHHSPSFAFFIRRWQVAASRLSMPSANKKVASVMTAADGCTGQVQFFLIFIFRSWLRFRVNWAHFSLPRHLQRSLSSSCSASLSPVTIIISDKLFLVDDSIA